MSFISWVLCGKSILFVSVCILFRIGIFEALWGEMWGQEGDSDAFFTQLSGNTVYDDTEPVLPHIFKEWRSEE
jgi:hypothetical protein